MSLVDLSAYDESTTNAPRNKLELIDRGGRRRSLGEGDETPDDTLVDFLRGRVSIDKVAPVVGVEGNSDGVGMSMGIVPLIREGGNRLIRIVRELV